MPSPRKIPPGPTHTNWLLASVALALCAVALLPAGAASATPLHRESARLAQRGRDLVLSVRAPRRLPLAKLEARPDTRRAAAAYLCVGFSAASDVDGPKTRDTGRVLAHQHDGERRVCVGGPRFGRRAGLVAVNAAGKPVRRGSVRATVKRSGDRGVTLDLVPGDAGLDPARYSWRVLESRGCDVRSRCASVLPPTGGRAFRLRPVRAVGCTGASDGLLTNASRDADVVALTFDDGPSEYTDDFLDVLREKGVHATFFEIGQEMAGREATMRRILAEGDEIGDHTMNHVEFPDYEQIAGAADLIDDYTGFKPCLFRPPGGAVDSAIVDTAAGLGMATINWDVDPRDWSLPGTGAIYSTITDTVQPGSIILMHDGGGPRDETLAALPDVIDTLRERGYSFETVSELLGHRLLYRPYG